MKHKSTYIDLFAGCGGLSLGLHNSKQWKGVFAIEKNKDAFQTLKHNLIDKKNHFDWPKWLSNSNHDINKILKSHKKDLFTLRSKIEMVVGGPPCQGFSTAGKRKESDSRNTLIKSYIRFIRIVQPKIIFFENVKGFTQKFDKNKKKGLAYSEYVIKQLKQNSSYYNSKGYHVYGKLVNFANYGIPQKRTRFILVGFRKDIFKNFAKEFFTTLESESEGFCRKKGISRNILLNEAISDLINGEKINYPENHGFQTTKYDSPNSAYQILLKGNTKTEIPDSHRIANHSKKIEKRFKKILRVAEKNKPLSKEMKLKLGIRKRTTIPTDPLENAPSLTTLPDDYIHYSEPRIFTVREYARIQSFNDWFQFKGKYTTGGKKRIKEVPRYSQIGNAIPPLFGEQAGHVLKSMLEWQK